MQNNSYEIRINGKKFEAKEPKITGKQVLEIAGLEPASDYELLLKLNNKAYEPVELNEVVDLTQPGIETFTAKPYKDMEIFVDDLPPMKVHECFMTPNEILIEAGFDPQKYYLKQIMDHKEITYKNDPDHTIAMKNHMRFATSKRDMENPEDHVFVAVITTSGSWPKEGFEKVTSNQKVSVFLKKAAHELKIVSTEGWIAKVDNKEIQVDNTYFENHLSGEVIIDYGPREGGGGTGE